MLIPVSVTKKASQEIKNILNTKEIPEDYSLRIGIRGAGCSGMGFILGFDKKKVTDKEYEIEGIKVFIDKKHLLYVAGLTIDFYEGDDATGFTFEMPGSSKT